MDGYHFLLIVFFCLSDCYSYYWLLIAIISIDYYCSYSDWQLLASILCCKSVLFLMEVAMESYGLIFHIYANVV